MLNKSVAIRNFRFSDICNLFLMFHPHNNIYVVMSTVLQECQLSGLNVNFMYQVILLYTCVSCFNSTNLVIKMILWQMIYFSVFE